MLSTVGGDAAVVGPSKPARTASPVLRRQRPAAGSVRATRPGDRTGTVIRPTMGRAASGTAETCSTAGSFPPSAPSAPSAVSAARAGHGAAGGVGFQRHCETGRTARMSWGRSGPAPNQRGPAAGVASRRVGRFALHRSGDSRARFSGPSTPPPATGSPPALLARRGTGMAEIRSHLRGGGSALT